MDTSLGRPPYRLLPRSKRFASLVSLSVLCAAALSGCGKSKGDAAAPQVSGCPDQSGVICTYAGDGRAGFLKGDGVPLLESSFYFPMDVTVTSTGEVYILDWNNHRVRHVKADHTLETVIGTEYIGDGPTDLSDLTPPGAPGTTCNLNHPTHLEELLDGTMMLAAWHNHKLRHYDPATGLVLVVCGSAPGYIGDGGMAISAELNQPPFVLQASDGSLYILDQRNQVVRKIDGMNEDGTDIITTAVGSGVRDTDGVAFGDGGPPLEARLDQPFGSNPSPGGSLAMDAQGRLYISDVLNQRVRRVDFTQNVIETVVGNGVASFGGDGGPGTQASLNNPRDLEFGPDGRLYIADEENHRIRAWDPATGIITTVAGNGTAGYSGDGGPATQAALNRPSGLAFDQLGRMYIADTFNNVIRRMRL